MDTGKKKRPPTTPAMPAVEAVPESAPPPTPPRADNRARRIARLAAVQALYQLNFSGESPTAVIGAFRADPSVLLDEDRTVTAVDAELCAEIVAGADHHRDALDSLIGGALSEKMSLARMEALLKCILRAGAYELRHRPQTDAGIVVNDYVEIAHGFFGAKEPGLVNAVLDRLARTAES